MRKFFIILLLLFLLTNTSFAGENIDIIKENSLADKLIQELELKQKNKKARSIEEIILVETLLKSKDITVPKTRGEIDHFSDNEVVKNIDTTVEINSDASVTVTEVWEFTSFGRDINYGMIFDIPVTFTNKKGSARSDFELLSASIDDKTDKNKISQWSKNGDYVELRIGDANEKLKNGRHTLMFKYRMSDVIAPFDDYDEFHWNTVSTATKFRKEQASIRVKLPNKEFGQGFKGIRWFGGRRGMTGIHMAELHNDTNEIWTTKVLNVDEGLTVVYIFDKGLITYRSWLWGVARSLKYLLIPILLLIAYYFLWLKYGVDKKLTIIPLFYPPEKIDPGTARGIVFASNDAVCFSSNIIDLAVKGYIKLTETTLTRTEKEVAFDDLPYLQGTIIEKLTVGEVVDLSAKPEVGKKTPIQTAYEIITKHIANKIPEYFSYGLGSMFLGGVFMLLFPLFALFDGFDTEVPFFIVAFFFVGVLLGSSLAIKKSRFFALILGIVFIGFITIGVSAMFSEIYSGFELFIMTGAVALCYLLSFIFGGLMPNYTKKGEDILPSILGFLMYMGTAEKDRIEMFAKDIKDTPDVFERYLPWALALDVAETWTNRFSSLLEKQNYQPEWYDGKAPFRYSLLGGWSSGISRASQHRPKSSQNNNKPNSGFSGFSGGGFSGSGRGGSGGRGW